MPDSTLSFLPTDFERFRPEVQRDPVHNAARLEVRRKLDAFGKRLAKRLEGEGRKFGSRASLHHPFRFNAFKVESQFVYLSRAPGERKALKSILGVELGKDLDQNYVHVILALSINQPGLIAALRVHRDAWWDGQNIKEQMKQPKGRERLAAELGKAAEFELQIDDNRSRLPLESITPGALNEKLKFYTPGEDWLHVERSWDRDDPFVTEEGLEDRLTEVFETLIPAYEAIRWTTDNNWLFRAN